MKAGCIKNQLCVAWDIIYRCNYRCPYCFFYGRWVEEEIRHPHMSAEQSLASWDRIYEKYGSAYIYLSGGEPFLHPAFIKIISELAKKHTLGIVTNLSWDPEKFIDIISPDRIDLYPSLHALFTPLGVFKEKLKYLKDRGFNLTSTMVGYPPVLNKVSIIKNEFEKSNLGLSILPFHGRYGEVFYPQGYTTKERELVGLFMFNDFATKKYQLEMSSTKGKLCSAGQAYMRVRPDGDVLRCAHSGLLGNIMNKNFQLLEQPALCDSDYCSCGNELIYIKEKS